MTAPFESQQRYGDLFSALVKAYSNTLTLRRITELGEDTAKQRVVERQPRHIPDERMVDLIMSFEEEQIFPTRHQLEEFLGGPIHVAQRMTDDIAGARVSAARAAVDSASLVFMHAALDGALKSLCKLSRALRPEEWKAIAKRKAKRGGRAGVLDRVFRLEIACGPVDNFAAVAGYVPNSSELERIDGLRQAIVHKGGAGFRELARIDKDLQFLAQTGLYYCGLVSRTHGVLINWRPGT